MTIIIYVLAKINYDKFITHHAIKNTVYTMKMKYIGNSNSFEVDLSTL